MKNQKQKLVSAWMGTREYTPLVVKRYGYMTSSPHFKWTKLYKLCIWRKNGECFEPKWANGEVCHRDTITVNSDLSVRIAKRGCINHK
jgi:hypothetical protein